MFVEAFPAPRSHSSISIWVSVERSRDALFTDGTGALVVFFSGCVPSSPIGRWRKTLRGVVNSVDSSTGIIDVLLLWQINALSSSEEISVPDNSNTPPYHLQVPN
jgi:hypothetical protein